MVRLLLLVATGEIRYLSLVEEINWDSGEIVFKKSGLDGKRSAETQKMAGFGAHAVSKFLAKGEDFLDSHQAVPAVDKFLEQHL